MQTPYTQYRYPFYNNSFYSSQRSLVSPYNKEKCQWSGYCKAFVVISLLLLVAWGIAVPLYFTVGPGTLPWGSDDPAITHVEAQMARATGNRKPKGIVLTAVNCTMRIINQQFTHYLENKYSSEFQSLRVKVESLLGKVFYKEKYFDKAVVTSFRPGSVVVQFVLLFTKKRQDVKEYTHHVLVNHIMSHWSMLGSYRTDLSSIQVNYISNKCAESNGGCSHSCVWTLLGDGYECQCPHGYGLMSDSRTCFKTASNMVVKTRMFDGCGEGQFLCQSGLCIPRQWVCDGVHDCVMGEDEAHTRCRSRRPEYIPPAAPVALPQQQAMAQKQTYNMLLGQEHNHLDQKQIDPYYHDQKQNDPSQDDQKQTYLHRDHHKEDDPQQNGEKEDDPYESVQKEDDPNQIVQKENHKQDTTPAMLSTTTTELSTSRTMPITVWEKRKPMTVTDFKIPGLENDLNGSKLKDSGTIKDPNYNGVFRRFKFFG